ncbi:hypothetical protein BDB01DRAFT_20547 [Pilobolus umbonatus]|nr:hypothetical protein BDB01DRAFT_20547 [Pilobolus umbonatus]
MSLTPVGLSLQAVTRNCAEFNEFAKVLSRQLVHDFGVECLPKKWDPDAEGYFEESDQDELDEDEYLVTVPIFSISSLLDTQSPRNDIHRTPRIISNKDIYTLIRDHYPYILKYLYTYYQALETNTMITSHHIITLMLQLKSCLPINQPPASTSVPQLNAITELCIITAYVISIILLPPIPYSKPPPLPSHLLEYCTEYATSLLVDIVLSAEDSIPPYPILLCSILLGWIKVETPTECRTDYLVHMALRLLCAVYEQNDTIEWRVMVASLLYLDIYSAIIQSKRPQLRGEGSSQLWRSIMRKRQSSEGLYNTGILLEAQLMSLLDRILSLFYEVKDKPLSDKKINVRKIDVDEVLTLVRDIELWENDLPEWIKWNTQNMNEPAYLSMKLHIHMIHNIAKILLYRPFCTEFINPDNKNEIQADEQTYTKTTFLDMSMISADRLVTCVHNLVRFGFSGYWINTASIAVRDVSGRVRQLFDKDEEISNQLKTIEDRLQRAERI